ncbi:MAG: hypothetical protein QOE55_46 [Acidobacteriaceae bacterium]|nr:hypothetical protein [Acidobacteriaceae bacterium]
MGNWFHELGLFVFAVLAHWQALATGGFATAMIGVFERRQKKNLSWRSYMAIVASFCLYAIFAAWQDEHRNAAAAITEKSSYASQFNECAVDLKGARSTLRDKESLADSLQRGIVALSGPQAQQAANIASCINNLAKMNPIIHEKISVIQSPFATLGYDGKMVNRNSPLKRYITELFVITNEPERTFHGKLKCSKDYRISIPPSIQPFAEMVMTGSEPPKMIASNEYEVAVDATGTEWNPSHPAYMQVISDDDNLGLCSFSPEE